MKCTAAMVACERRPGLDLLRVLAASLVFLQHALGTSNHADWIEVGGFRVGRFGTSLFFLLAGFLAAGSSRAPGAWFRGRLAAIYPAFWLVTCVGFCFAAIPGFKSFDVWQVLSQMAGLGYFTHGERMINVPTWFISPLLVLYCVVLVVRQFNSFSGWWVALAAALWLAMSQHEHQGTVGCHALTFFCAALIAQQPPSVQRHWCLGAAALMAALMPEQHELFYGAISLTALAASTGLQERWRLAERFTIYAYEWFLVHGICLLMVARLTTSFMVLTPIAMVVSVIAAVLLKRFVRRMNQRVTNAVLMVRLQAIFRNARCVTTDSETTNAVCGQRLLPGSIQLSEDSAALDNTMDLSSGDSVAGQSIFRYSAASLDSSRETVV